MNDYFPTEASPMLKKKSKTLSNTPSRLQIKISDTKKIALLEAKRVMQILNESNGSHRNKNQSITMNGSNKADK